MVGAEEGEEFALDCVLPALANVISSVAPHARDSTSFQALSSKALGSVSLALWEHQHQPGACSLGLGPVVPPPNLPRSNDHFSSLPSGGRCFPTLTPVIRH